MKKIKKFLWVLAVLPLLVLGLAKENVAFAQGQKISIGEKESSEIVELFVYSEEHTNVPNIEALTLNENRGTIIGLHYVPADEGTGTAQYLLIYSNDLSANGYFTYKLTNLNLLQAIVVFEADSGIVEGEHNSGIGEMLNYYCSQLAVGEQIDDQLLMNIFYWNNDYVYTDNGYPNGRFEMENPFDSGTPEEPPVVDEEPPIINGQTAYVTSISNKVTLEEIKAGITVIDNEDGDITDSLVVESDNYSQSTTIGNYEIKFKATDSAGNVGRLTVLVVVKDVTKPAFTVSGGTIFHLSYRSKVSLEYFKAYITVTDNYDSEVPLELELDYYSDNYDKLGTYSIIFSATDSSNNKAEIELTVHVLDDVAPTITGPEQIVKGQTVILTLEDIMDEIEYEDELDLMPVLEVVTDNYTGNGDVPGLYLIVFKVTDSAGNYATHEVQVRVRDDIAPVFIVNENFINVSKALSLTQEDFIQLLVATGQLTISSSTQIEFLQNDYAGNEDTVGTYTVRIKASSQNGTSSTYEITTNVIDLNNEDAIVVEPGAWHVQLKNWFSKPLKEGGKFLVWHLIVCIVGGLGLVGGLVFLLKPKYRFRKRW